MARRIAMITMHTSPLAKPGIGDAGGLNVYVRELSKALAMLDVEIDIFTRSRTPNVRRIVALGDGVRVITLPAGPRKPLPKEHLPSYVCGFASNIVGFVAEQGLSYDLVHSHYWLSGIVGLKLRERWDVPLVHMFHTLSRLKMAHGAEDTTAGTQQHLNTRQSGEERVLSMADAIVTATSLERQALLGAYDVRAAIVHTIPCGVDGAAFYPGDRAAAQRELNLAGRHTIVAAGRFEALKGFDVLLQAAAQLRDEHPGLASALRVIIAGGPARTSSESGSTSDGYRGYLEKLIGDLQLQHNVVLPGALGRTDLARYFRAADVCAVPSHYESFGLTALEAMACGTPVVASRAGGLQLTVHDGVNGYLAPPGDSAALASRLAMILGNEYLRDTLGRAAARVAEPYSWAAVAERILCLYTYLSPSAHRLYAVGG